VRYPEAKVKEAILHPDIEIRDRAAMYFAKSFSADLTIMPLVIKAVETYGRQNDAYRLIGASRDLLQTEDTIAWVIDELNGEADKYENYAYNLSMVLLDADAALLLSRESDILEARHFLADLRTPFTDRLRMLSWDEATCWRNLEEFCEEGKDKRYTNEVNLSNANMVVEALARYGQECEPKVREWLAVKLDDYSHHPMKWLEPLVVRLAGQAQLESTIPLIVAKLLDDGGDLLNEECADALTRIGTPAVLHAVAEAFPAAEQHFRIYATNPLEHIHSDLAVEITLKLLEKEKDQVIRCHLADSLLFQLAKEGIEIARQLLIGQELDFTSKGLRNSLLETCTLMGERFPEYEEWLATEKAEKAEHWRRVKELESDPERLMLFALEKLTGKKAPEIPKAKAPVLPPPRPTLPRKPEVKQKVGRNDPCPCGSGKKFKHCCMRK
jgi:DNA-binding Lrp family transcriptional regulator